MDSYEPVGLDLSLTSTGVAVSDVTAAISVGVTGAERLEIGRAHV